MTPISQADRQEVEIAILNHAIGALFQVCPDKAMLRELFVTSSQRLIDSLNNQPNKQPAQVGEIVRRQLLTSLD